MSISDRLLPEFDQEMAGTRRVLECVPDDKLEWRAHPKSNTIAWVATHLAQIPGWTVEVIAGDSLDINPPGGEPYVSPSANSRAEFLELFDKQVAAAREVIATTEDTQWDQPWTLLNHGKVVFTMPKYSVVRNMVLNHSVHHRAYLCAYLRLNDIPVPGLYGPSGDESGS